MSGATARTAPKTLPLDFFAKDSRASVALVEMLNRSQDGKLVGKLTRHWNQYTTGLNDLMPCRGTTQGIMIDLWTDRFIQSGQEVFGELLEKHGIEYSYYVNVLHARRARARDMGAIYQKMETS